MWIPFKFEYGVLFNWSPIHLNASNTGTDMIWGNKYCKTGMLKDRDSAFRYMTEVKVYQIFYLTKGGAYFI
jgi:hypothetical protein